MASRVDEGLKRKVDIVGGVAGLVFLSPVMIAAAVAVRLSMGAPVLLGQERPGLHGRPFRLFKLRTMRPPLDGENMVASDSRRLTPVGRFLRSWSLDELPTLWNVIRGDMSLVGPRPLLTQYVNRYSPTQARRHEVKPGITGWAQINGRNALSWDEKFDLDVWYVDNRSTVLDLKILALTVCRVMNREGVSHGHEATMPEFMGSDGGQNA